ncbi:MAG: SBBP repeat-containing protein [Bacteroidota bacterium]
MKGYIIYGEVYNKTDVIFANNNAGMKFQIIMNKGAEPQAVLHFTGHQSLQLINNSDLQVNGILGSFIYERPLVYQLDLDGNRISLGWLASYYIDGDDVSFVLPGIYDHGKPLVLECAKGVLPHILHGGDNHQWASYLPGDGYDEGTGVITDSDGNPFFVGVTSSSNFPAQLGINGSNVFLTPIGGMDIYVAKIRYPIYTSAGDMPLYITYFGGTKDDFANGVAVDLSGSPFITGSTISDDFPLGQEDTYTYYQETRSGGKDAFIFKLDGADGHKRYSSYVGGGNDDEGKCITLDGSNNIFIAGYTESPACSTSSFCLVPAAQSPVDNGFPLCDGGGSYFVSNNGGSKDGFVFKLDNVGNLVWSTFIGGTAEDVVNCFTLDAANNLFMAGRTSSATDFPKHDDTGTLLDYYQSANGGATGTFDGFIMKFDNGGFRKWASYMGGDGEDEIFGIDVDQEFSNSIYVTGTTSSATPACSTCYCQAPNLGEFPLCDLNTGSSNDYYEPQFGGETDAFIQKYSNIGQMKWSTYFGSVNADNAKSIVVDKIYTDLGTSPHVTIAGRTFSETIPLTNPNTANVGIILGGGLLWNNGGINGTPWLTPPNSEAYLEMFTTDGIPMWGVTYGEAYLWGNSADIGGEQANSITSTKGIADPADKQLYITGFTDNLNYPTTCFQPFGNTCWTIEIPDGNISVASPDAFTLRLSYTPHLTGLDENKIDNSDGIIIYPNPTTESISVSAKVSIGKQKPHFRIYNLLGAMLFDQEIKSSGTILTTSINVGWLESGTYVAQIVFDDKICVKQFILTK